MCYVRSSKRSVFISSVQLPMQYFGCTTPKSNANVHIIKSTHTTPYHESVSSVPPSATKPSLPISTRQSLPLTITQTIPPPTISTPPKPAHHISSRPLAQFRNPMTIRLRSRLAAARLRERIEPSRGVPRRPWGLLLGT